MVDDDNFARPQQLLGNDDAAQGFSDAPASVADDMRVAFFEAERSSSVCFYIRQRTFKINRMRQLMCVPRRASMQATTATFLFGSASIVTDFNIWKW